ncbi:Metallo-dependent hydrolase [Teratosphaeria nubilosa]|uniref:adenosine deaminase n=1 Tax=Teratosphaeria nubilosa TaxID=161662 RepID=A0A6G1LMY0_9PEZI|nr:Metallo-dependent hydrolase [Teratosphaeria nubilosa]
MGSVNGLGLPTKPSTVVGDSAAVESSVADYGKRRSELLNDEKAQRWDAKARAKASSTELEAQCIVYKLRENERIDLNLFGDVPGEAIPLRSTRDMGGHFLINKPRIDRSRVFDVVKAMPKGCHLHIHFNTELPPELLFFHARKLERTMYIRTTRPLLTDADYAGAEFMFDVFPEDKSKADCFSESYNPSWKNTDNSPWMLWSDFRRRFPKHLQVEDRGEGLDAAECWAQEKQVFTRERAYDEHQTVNGVWACFNIGTRAFKGLMNYESVYRWYIGAAIDSMIRDKVMYAELRPMLLDKSIPSDDGTRRLDHNAQMNIICEEVDKKHRDLRSREQIDKFPFSLKIIYCTPRSVTRAKMEGELEDCIRLKQRYPALICGFDLVGAEDRPNHIGFYADLLVGFQKRCEELQIEIPFLFHAGESLLDTGGSFDPDKSNLYDSLLLNSRRVGHGYALLKHPLLIEKFKAQNICLELCPISNELLHLCGNAREHPFPALLAAGLHCTLNADNPSLFRGATTETLPLSYEFYQVMVGDTRMTIHGWKQLALWSIEHSCLTKQERERAFKIFESDWEEFCHNVVAKYTAYSDEVCGVCYKHRCEDFKHQGAATA